MADSTTLKDPPKIASNKPMVAPMAPANPDPAAEATPQQRLEALLASIKANYAHNAPIAPAHISELDALVRLGRGDKSMVPSHNFPNDVMIAKPDGTVAVVWSAEQALDYVRALPDDVRNRPYWVAAEKALLSAIDNSGDVKAAQVALDDAISKDRADTTIDRPADERLPDGRIRDDRFPDRRPPPPPEDASKKAF
jgi:hypothetical protein